MKDFLNIVFGLFVALLDRYSEHSQESERWRHAANGHGSDWNPGQLLSAIRHLVAFSSNWAKPAPESKVI